MQTEIREEKPCTMCGTPTVDQWGGYCHDCDSYFESVILDQAIDASRTWEREQVKETD